MSYFLSFLKIPRLHNIYDCLIELAVSLSEKILSDTKNRNADKK